MKNSTKKRLTISNLLASVWASGGRVSSGVSLSGDNNEYNRDIFKAFKPIHKASYGPVFPDSERGRQLTAGDVI